MKTVKLFFGVLLLSLLMFSSASAAVGLYEWGVSHNGTVSQSTPVSGFNFGAFDFSTGLGTITANVTGFGNHYIGVYFDHEIDEAINTYFNEFGLSHGSLAAGQSWEIDEPGFVFGDIFNNFSAGALDNSNGVPSTSPDDVAMALGWAFNLAAGETASITFTVGQTAPQSIFYLEQTDPDSQESIYAWSNSKRGGGNQIPEPGTLVLLAAGLAGLAGMGRKMK